MFEIYSLFKAVAMHKLSLALGIVGMHGSAGPHKRTHHTAYVRTGSKPNKYTPHQGIRERARRLNQL